MFRLHDDVHVAEIVIKILAFILRLSAKGLLLMSTRGLLLLLLDTRFTTGKRSTVQPLTEELGRLLSRIPGYFCGAQCQK